MDEGKLAKELEECQKTVAHLEAEKNTLEEENRHLRRAAGTFGRLAERLNVTLREERRRTEAERRHTHRDTPDRRRG